jgi:hypothetical protein
MNFLTSVLVGVAFLHVEAVPYGSPELDQNTYQYTLYALAGAIGLPLVVGIIYTQISMYRARRAAVSSASKSATTNEVFSASLSSKKSTVATYIVRLNDMRSNPVLRLWWNRQAKLYSTSENDLEAQRDPEEGGETVQNKSSFYVKKQSKEKKSNETGDAVTDKKTKKEKKDKKEKAELDSDNQEPKVKKEKKSHKHDKKSKKDQSDDELNNTP